jgi:hypothetical protein
VERPSLNADEIAIATDGSISDDALKTTLISYGFDRFGLIQTATEAIPDFLNQIKLAFGLLGNVIGFIGIIVASITIFIVIFINAVTRRKYIEIQKEIVEQIEVKQNAIDHAKAIIQNLERERRYFGQALRKLEGVEWVELGELFEKVGDQINPQNSSGEVVYIGLENIESNSGNIVGEINTEIKSIRSIKNVFKESDILYGKLRPNLNKVWLADRKGICSTDILVLRKKKEEMNSWLYTIILRRSILRRVGMLVKMIQVRLRS